MSERPPENPEPETEAGMVEVSDFDWLDYFERINEKVPHKKLFSGVPDSAFIHVEASLDSGVKEGYVVEYQWDEKNNTYWLAVVKSVFGPLLKLTYVGEAKQGEIWHDLSKKRLFPLGWCQLNKFNLEPPEHLRSDCSEWESLALQYLEDVSYDTIPMHHIDGEGVTPIDRLKLGMVLDLQDSEYSYDFWPVIIIANRGGLLTLEYVQYKGQHETFFYLSPRLFPKGYAAETEHCKYVVPKKLMSLQRENEDTNFDVSQIPNPSVPNDLISAKVPNKHKFGLGLNLEMIHPVTSRLERFMVIKEINEYFFIVIKVNEGYAGLRKVTSLLDPTIFPCGTYKSLRSVSSPINEANAQGEVSGKVVQKRNFPEFASAEELGFGERQKLEVYDGSKFRTATIIETKNHLLVLELDSSTDNKVHLFKSAHSMDIFPLGWCSTNGIMLNIPKTFLPDVPIDDVAAEETKEDKPEVEKPEDPVASSWCPKVYFNYKCYSASFLSKARLAGLPKAVGPGSVNLVIRTVLNLLIGSSFKSGSVLKRLELKEDSNPRQFFVVEEFKGKSRVVNLKANVEIPTRKDQVDSYLTEVCKKVGACPHLVSTRLFEEGCPEDCQTKPKSEFDLAQPKQGNNNNHSSKPKTSLARKRRHPDSHLLEKCSGLNSTTPSDDESDNTPATSRASSPMEIRKRGRLSRGAKLNQFQNNKDKFMTIAAKASRAQQQQDKSNKKSLIKREISSASSKYGYQNDVPAAHEDPEDSSDEYEDSGSDPEDPPPIRNLKLLSNPEYWSPMDTARFLAQTSDCQHLAHLMLEEAIDGQAFMLLTYPTVRDHWQLKTKVSIQLCQHIESVRLAHITQF